MLNIQLWNKVGCVMFLKNSKFGVSFISCLNLGYVK